MVLKNSVIIILSIFINFSSAYAAEDNFSPHVDKQGNISFPKDFRTSMVHLGSWFVPKGEASGFHDVYTEKTSIEHFKKQGSFPDGTVIVKQLRGSVSNTYTTGKNVSHASKKLKQWFVMIKDNKGRFANNPVWGDGWGWALFKPGAVKTNVTTNYKTDCKGCHIPAKDKDWIYTEAYNILN